MALSGLATRNVVNYVRRFHICGAFRDADLRDHAQAGRVPDGSMLLNTLVRVAIERMEGLEEFSWELDTKMLPIVWQCLPTKSTVKKLTVKFPSTRDPRPTALAPPIPSLEYLCIHDMDPLCYNDDISLLLLGSKKIKTLKLHWSPRMREQCEPSIHPPAYIGRMVAAGNKMPLRSFTLCNFFVPTTTEAQVWFDNNTLEEMTFLSCKGGAGDSGAFFLEAEKFQRSEEAIIVPNLKSCRTDKFSTAYSEKLSKFQGLQKFFCVGPQARPYHAAEHNGSLPAGSLTAGPGPSPVSRSSDSNSTSTIRNPDQINPLTALKDNYLDTLTTFHGSTLTHLLLLPQWRLTSDDVSRLVRLCPNLEQLAAGFRTDGMKTGRLLYPFLPKLQVWRSLALSEDPDFISQIQEWYEEPGPLMRLKWGLQLQDYPSLRYVDLGGDDHIYKVGHRWSVGFDADGKELFERHVTQAPRSEVQEYAVWKMDSTDF